MLSYAAYFALLVGMVAGKSRVKGIRCFIFIYQCFEIGEVFVACVGLWMTYIAEELAVVRYTRIYRYTSARIHMNTYTHIVALDMFGIKDKNKVLPIYAQIVLLCGFYCFVFSRKQKVIKPKTVRAFLQLIRLMT